MTMDPERDCEVDEAELALNEKHFRGYFDLGLIGMALTSLDKDWVQVNDRLCEILGYAREVLATKTWADITHPDDLDADVAEFDRVLAGEIEGYSMEKRFLHGTDGHVVHARISARCVRRDDGDIDHFVALVDDISDIKEAQLKLEERVRLRTSELQTAHFSLEQSRDRLIRLVDSLGAGVVVHGPDTAITLTNPKAAELLGLDRQALMGRTAADPTWQFVDGDDRSLPPSEFPVNRIIRTGKAIKDLIVGIKRPDRDRTVWVLVNGFPLTNSEGELIEEIISFVDISDIREAESNLRQAAAVFENTIEGVIITDANATILDVNPAFSQITGYNREEVIGQNPSILKSGRHGQDFYEAMWQSLDSNGYWRGEIWNKQKGGSVYPELLTISAVPGANGLTRAYIGVFNDISVIKKSEEQLHYIAHHDALTGLPNRLLFLSILEQRLAQAKRQGTSIAVVFIDLDHFKSVNDSLGHTVGDELLKAFAARLKALLREVDTVARQSGDEFVVLLDHMRGQDEAIVAIERLRTVFDEPFAASENRLRVTGSLGISLYPQDGTKAQELMRNADAAMYRVKDEGRNSYQFFTEEINRSAFSRALITNALGDAIERAELEIYYQPQVHLESRQVAGVEALLRWTHPSLGSVSPAEFIPIAEQTGAIRQIGRHVLEKACAQAKHWLDSGIEFGHLSLNVSGRQMAGSDLLTEVKTALAETGFPPSRLVIEITESVLTTPSDEAVGLLRKIRALGIEVAIDDFGTGYSSLSYLSKLPVDVLKIDREFVRDITSDTRDAAIVQAVIGLGAALGLQVVAEGVETESQASFLLHQGCSMAQGYLYGRPVPQEDLRLVCAPNTKPV